MKKITKGLLSLIFLLGSIFLFTKGSQATTLNKTRLENKKESSLILKHHRDLKKADMITWSWESDRESGRNHWSHWSHWSHSSHYSHYSSRY